MTIARSGGVAGFHDRVVVAADGSVTATTGGGAAACSVDPPFLRGLQRTAGSATGTPSSAATGPDALSVTITTAQGAMALDAGALPSSAPEVGQLLDDLAKPSGQRSVCR